MIRYLNINQKWDQAGTKHCAFYIIVKMLYCIILNFPIFLAATSSSRSDVVTKSVRPFIRLSIHSSVRSYPFFSLVSLKSVVHLECHKASKSIKGTQLESLCVSRVFQSVFQGSFKGVSRKFQGCFKSVSRVFRGSFKQDFQASFKQVQRVSKGVNVCFKGVSRVFHGCFKGVSRVFHGCFKRVRAFRGCFKVVSRVFQGSFHG